MSDSRHGRPGQGGPARLQDLSRDTGLRGAFLESPPAGAAAVGEPCPADGAIWRAVQGELDPGELTGILEHASRCPECDASWKLARLLAAEAGAGRATPAARAWRPGRWLGAAAALVLVSIAWIWLVRTPGPEPATPATEPVFRAGSPVEITTPLPDGATLPRDRFVLTWAGLPVGSLATVELADGDLRLLHRAEEVPSRSVQIPATDLAGVAADAPLLWRVEAVLPDGRRVSSPTFRVRLGD